MDYLVQDLGKKNLTYKSIVIKDASTFGVISNKLAMKIIKKLSENPGCAMDLARQLDQHEQKIYYHIRNLEDTGLIELIRTEQRTGGTAKIYGVPYQAISLKLTERGEEIPDIGLDENQLLKPFIEGAKFNSLIIVGSPEPHGVFKAPALDASCGIDLGVFLGSFLKKISYPYYRVDVQLREEDYKKNLFLIGGPKSNIISEKINEDLPIYFDYSSPDSDWNIISKLSNTTYRKKTNGVIIKTENPFDENKQIFLLAGKGYKGTVAAVLGFIKYFNEINKGNSNNPKIIAKVVEGLDLDSNNIIDDVEFLE
ncbi:MAG: helix-turn-helix domain-containing protein [Candidatus Aenigmarchaeota archaeon]|nr:helix-turn-helix domain-containing protein [Candidatus Aenigmarchaeota archaeon]